MSIFSQITEKPWQVIDADLIETRSRGFASLSNPRLGLRIFFAVVTVLFFLLTIAYAERIATEQWRPQPQLALLWTSTVFLVLASIGMQWAKHTARQHRAKAVKLGLIVGGVFAFAFLGSQLMAWQQLSSIAVLNIANPAIAFFYLITAAHGLHLIGGLVAWGRTITKIWRGCALNDTRESIELCTSYWHFLLVVWMILFGLLFSGNDNLAILLAICGIK